MLKKFPVLLLALFISVASVFAQDAQVRNLASGQKYKIKGVVVARDNNSFTVRDSAGVNTRVVLSPNTSIKTKGGFFGGGNSIAADQVIRGLNLQVEGRGDNVGSLSAEKVRFDDDDLRVAQSIQSRVDPVEDRLTQSEQNAQRISGQIDELMAISNAARGGAKAAQDTADAAIAGVNATNQRISSIDDFVVQTSQTVNFKVGSAVLSPDAKQNLDNLAQTALTMKGYLIEVTGFASADGNARKNKELSRRRAQAVLDYLIETHNIPLRRIGTSYGFGAAQAVADNSTREGRAQNRRVEVKLTVSKGLNQNVEVRKDASTNSNDQ
ncbi:MAG: OmpA family protein [Acidobacteria bacterium]|jgi:outer membrane protein OmpA-like peptidoglycan-associated protein|nr:OmpA family protein [Acidobacteriota bacterium]